MDILKRAYELKDELVKDRRNIHQFAELGFDTKNTAAYVAKELQSIGYETIELIENSVVTTIGNGGKVFLLRADMDALPMKEDSGLEFASTNGNSHSCGHDTHTAMLLTAAKILKENEDKLNGTVKLMFQPAEELLLGADKMLKAGILENPKVDCGLMIHINSMSKKGIGIVSGPKAAANNNFKITVNGKGTHGAMPEKGVDPVIIGSNIVLGLQELLTREISFTEGAVITTGHFEAGTSNNTIPNTAIIEGTMRTFSGETKAHLKKRIPEVVKSIAETYRGTADFEYTSDVPVMVNDPNFTKSISKYIDNLSKDNFDFYEVTPVAGSEDFAFISQEIPSCMINLGAPNPDSEQLYPIHHPKVVFDEEALPIGAAVLADCAIKWLNENK